MIGLTEVLMVWVGGRPADSVYPHPESRASRKSRIHKIAQLRERTWLPFRDDCGEVRARVRSDQIWGVDISCALRRPRSSSSPPSHNSKAHLPLTSPRNSSSCTPYVATSYSYTRLECADHRCAPIDHRRPEERCLWPELLQLRRDVSIAYIEEGFVAHLLFQLRLQGRRVQVLNASPLPSPSLSLMCSDHIPLHPRSSLAWVVRVQHVG